MRWPLVFVATALVAGGQAAGGQATAEEPPATQPQPAQPQPRQVQPGQPQSRQPPPSEPAPFSAPAEPPDPSPAPVPFAEAKLVGVTEPAGEEPAVSDALIVAYTFGGLGVATLIAGSLTGALAILKTRELRRACGGNQCAMLARADFEARRDEVLLVAHLSTASFAVSGLSFGLAIGAWAVDEAGAGSVVVVRPGSLSWRGRF